MRVLLLLMCLVLLASCGGDDVETNPFPGGPDADRLCQLQADMSATTLVTDTSAPTQEDVIEDFNEIAEAAPEEIKDDAQYTADMMQVQLDVLNEIIAGELPYEDMQSAMEERGFDDARLQQSVSAVNNWLVSNCGIDEITTTTMGSLSTATTPGVGSPGASAPGTDGAATTTANSTPATATTTAG